VVVYIREDDREDVHSTNVQTQKILPRHHSAFGIRLEIFEMDIFYHGSDVANSRESECLTTGKNRE
jgi:hypothetical protein